MPTTASGRRKRTARSTSPMSRVDSSPSLTMAVGGARDVDADLDGPGGDDVARLQRHAPLDAPPVELGAVAAAEVLGVERVLAERDAQVAARDAIVVDDVGDVARAADHDLGMVAHVDEAAVAIAAHHDAAGGARVRKLLFACLANGRRRSVGCAHRTAV